MTENCTHGGDCTLHPQSQMLHNYDEHGRKSPLITSRFIAHLTQKAMNEGVGMVRGSTLSERPDASLLLDVADPTGPNGMRSFVLTVREV